MPRIAVEFVLDAPPDSVWAVLIDFKAYSEWHPFQTIEGAPEPLSTLRIRTTKLGTSKFLADEKAIVWKVRPYTKFEYLGGRLGKRFFHLTPQGEGTRLMHGLAISSLWVNRLLAPRYDIRNLQPYYEAVSIALEKRLASPHGSTPRTPSRRQRRIAASKHRHDKL